MAGQHDLVELSRHLKQERLFINSERDQLQTLHSQVSKSAENLYHLSWITRRQKTNLDQLILGHKEMTPLVCCQRSNALERVGFIDGYKMLSYHEGKIGEFLKNLRENPKLVASCLLHAEKISQDAMKQTAHIVVSGLYGNSVMHEDESYLLLVLKSLIEQQLAQNDNPRRMLRKGSCTFSVIFKLLNEGMYSAKLFLTAALHQPVMQLLMEDEWFYDIDPDRALYRFPPQQRQSRFGEPGTDDYDSKTKQYRDLTTDKLVILAECFINSLKNNMHCFPQSLAWIISQMYHTLRKSGSISATDAKALCADLVFASFICPAICDPEPFGITSDVPISYIARHNLMQVAQILQVLAIREWEDTDAKTRDLYNKFQNGCMSFLLDTLLETPCSEQVPQSNNQLSAFNRAAVLLTLSELLQLLTFLRNLTSSLDVDDPVSKTLASLTEHVASPAVLQALQTQSTGSHSDYLLSSSPGTTPQPTPPGTPSSTKKTSKNKDKKRGYFLTPDASNSHDDIDEGEGSKVKEQEDILVISLGVVNECPGMQAEQKVLEQEGRQRKAKYNSLLPGEDDPVSESEINLHEKRTRFSLSHDQDSIATSDNLEAISEAASSHSVGSDLDDNENDNLSDMVSANVSGRGTPNISGRDTPVSQAESQAEGGEERPAPNLPVIVQKTNREDVTDRFGKFDIKQELENDIKSTVSDTWSTDVLASDSEPPEQNQLERLEEVAEEMVRHNLLGVQEVCEISETASDAWSTDVLASDTSERQSERLLELEQDDTGSVSSRGQPPDDNESTTDPTESHEGTPQPQDALARKSQDYSTGGSGESDLFLPLEGTPASSNRAPRQKWGPCRERDSPPDQFLPVFDCQQLGLLKKPIRRAEDARGPEGSGEGGNPRRQCVSEFITSFNKPQEQNYRAADKRVSESLMYAQGRVSKALQTIEKPDEEERKLEDYQPESPDNPNLLDSGSVRCSLASSAQTLVSESSLMSPVSNVTTPAAGEDVAVFRHDSELSGGVGGAFDDSLNMSDSFPTATNGLKLSEQQNTNIDAHRLSGVVNLYDPLMDGGNSNMANKGSVGSNLSGEGFRPVSSILNSSSSVPPSYTRLSYNEMGARPRVPLGEHAAPKIALKLNSLSLDISEDTPDRALPISTPHTYDDQKQRISLSSDADNCDTDSSSVHSNASVGVVNKETVLSEVAMKRHSSTLSESSSTSSLVDMVAGSAPTSASRNSRDKQDALLTQVAPTACSTPAKVKVNDSKDADDRKQDSARKKGGFFSTFKEKLSKGGKRKGKGSEKDEAVPREIADGIRPMSAPVDTSDDVFVPKQRSAMSAARSAEDPGPSTMETTDDILAKYRKHIPASTLKPVVDSASSTLPTNQGKDKHARSREEDDLTTTPAYDPSNLETCKAFIDAKKKLRLVLSTADFQTMPGVSGGISTSAFMRVPGGGMGGERKENDLVGFLKVQLAEAINLQDRNLIAQLHETIRCLRQFDNIETRKLLKTMREEYRGRAPYVAYLVRSRQGLLSTEAHLERMLDRVARDKAVVNKYFLSVFVRLFLEKRQRSLDKFLIDFQKFSVSDEKTEHVEKYLAHTYRRIEEDPVWQAASESQREEAGLYIERSIMNHIYTYAMYPNGDGDMLRDQILHDHMRKLGAVISPSHKDLAIPAMYHYECPWPAAQREIYMINAYKTPKDKLCCVLRCSSTIMNLLRMANEKSVPAADDFMPVLIFVLIKANPPSLLSTVQYVNSFYSKRLGGEEQYWWTQFTSVVEFIKTMVYGLL